MKKLNRLSNCLIAAIWIWISSRGRIWIGLTRSHSFRGVIPHFGVGQPLSWRFARAIELVPPKRELWTRRNKLILFDGKYRVWHFRVVAVRRFETKAEALADLYSGSGYACQSDCPRRMESLPPAHRQAVACAE